jgi:hypothetical protein
MPISCWLKVSDGTPNWASSFHHIVHASAIALAVVICLF